MGTSPLCTTREPETFGTRLPVWTSLRASTGRVRHRRHWRNRSPTRSTGSKGLGCSGGGVPAHRGRELLSDPDVPPSKETGVGTRRPNPDLHAGGVRPVRVRGVRGVGRWGTLGRARPRLSSRGPGSLWETRGGVHGARPGRVQDSSSSFLLHPRK